ncbi:MAG: restriction endonuclease subunit S, partial [Prevotella sp.]|nr:restriction endonuclease subunit S [Prevotella sp.]
MPQSEGGTKKFKIGELFTSANGDFDIQKTHLNGRGVDVISSGESNNGVIGKTDVLARIFLANTLTVDMFGNSYYHQRPYKIVTHARVFSLMPIEGKFLMSERIGLFLIAKFRFFKQMFSYNNMCSWEKIRQLTIEMPVDKYGDIDFAYIEERVRELEEERVRELEAYLKVAGLTDCSLTLAEREALNNLNSGGVIRK